MRHVQTIDTPSFVSRRRRVDWSLILGPGRDRPAPKVMERPVHGQLGALLSAFDDILPLENRDAILRQAVEVALEKIGLARAAIFLFDGTRNMMLGSWGTDLHGDIVDEHHIMYSLSDTDREAFRRARVVGAHFTVFDDCPLIEHRGQETRVAGRGWLACTPIVSAHATIGMLFNDGGISGVAVDETRQAHAAILCALLATILDPVRSVPGAGGTGPAESAGGRLATAAASILAQDPAIDARALARRLEVGLGRFARVFKAEMGMSLVEYRNRVRLDRLDTLLAKGGMSLLEAARGAGFGSYAQFHRVFRRLRGMTPREYVRCRR